MATTSLMLELPTVITYRYHVHRAVIGSQGLRSQAERHSWPPRPVIVRAHLSYA